MLEKKKFKRFLRVGINNINGLPCVEVSGFLLTQEVIDMVIEELKDIKPQLPTANSFINYAVGNSPRDEFSPRHRDQLRRS